MTPIGRGPLLLVLNVSTTVLVPVMSMGNGQGASDLLTGWAFALVYTNVTAVPAVAGRAGDRGTAGAPPLAVPRRRAGRDHPLRGDGLPGGPVPADVDGRRRARGLLAAVPAHDAGSVPAVGRVRTRRVFVRLDAGTSASQRRAAPRAGARRRAGRAAGRRGSPALARVAAPSALPLQHAELDQRAHHDRSPAGRADRGPAVRAAACVARHERAVADSPGATSWRWSRTTSTSSGRASATGCGAASRRRRSCGTPRCRRSRSSRWWRTP